MDPLQGRRVTGRRVVVFGGGNPPSPRAIERLPAGALVIAADSGLRPRPRPRHRRGCARRRPRLDLARCTRGGEGLPACRSTSIPTAKDATDLALALLTARDAGAAHVTVVAGDGGAPRPPPHGAPRAGGSRVGRHRRRRMDRRRVGARCSTAPVALSSTADRVSSSRSRAVGGPAIGVRTEALVYPLHDETLDRRLDPRRQQRVRGDGGEVSAGGRDAPDRATGRRWHESGSRSCSSALLALSRVSVDACQGHATGTPNEPVTITLAHARLVRGRRRLARRIHQADRLHREGAARPATPARW